MVIGIEHEGKGEAARAFVELADIVSRPAGVETVVEVANGVIPDDEASCVVYGMPKVAWELGAVDKQLPLGSISRAILDLCALEVRGAA